MLAACTSAPHQLVLPNCVLFCWAHTHLQTDDHSQPAPEQPKKEERP